MSIYQSKSKPPVGEGDVTQTVVRGAVATLNEPRHGPGSSQDWTGARKARPVNYLLPASMKWLTRLPKEIRPWALARQYPRIANFLALEWDQPESCAGWFDNLLVDQRGGTRQGFPADVHREVSALQVYFHRQSLSLSE